MSEPEIAIQVLMMPRDANPLPPLSGEPSGLAADFGLRRRHPQLYRPGRGHRRPPRGPPGRRGAAVLGDGGHQPRGVSQAGAGRGRGAFPDPAGAAGADVGDGAACAWRSSATARCCTSPRRRWCTSGWTPPRAGRCRCCLEKKKPRAKRSHFARGLRVESFPLTSVRTARPTAKR